MIQVEQIDPSRFRLLIDTIPVEIWSGPADGTLDFCNARWLEEKGLTLEEIQGDGWQRMLHPEDAPRVLRAWNESVCTGNAYEQQERHRMRNGEYRWFLCRGTAVRDTTGKIVRWLGCNSDIHEQKVAEEAARARLVREKAYIEDEVRREGGFDRIIGESRAVVDLLQQVDAVAPTESTVLILGESGTGKELVARAIHDRSLRRDRPFIKVDCAAVAASLMESEFFGYERGAFTGAIAQKIGRLETADQGTLFLDEVGEVPMELQSKLLRVLQDRAFERIGSNRARQVDVRIVAATNQDLKEMVKTGKFREDLYSRLKVFPISIPPLRERTEDIPALVRHYVAKYARRMKRETISVPEPVMATFMQYPWPGNVRELQHLVERSVVLSTGTVFQPPLGELDQLMQKKQSQAKSSSQWRSLEDLEREWILEALRASDWVVGGPDGAAVKLGLKRTTLASRMERHGIFRERS